VVESVVGTDVLLRDEGDALHGTPLETGEPTMKIFKVYARGIRDPLGWSPRSRKQVAGGGGAMSKARTDARSGLLARWSRVDSVESKIAFV